MSMLTQGNQPVSSPVCLGGRWYLCLEATLKEDGQRFLESVLPVVTAHGGSWALFGLAKQARCSAMHLGKWKQLPKKKSGP